MNKILVVDDEKNICKIVKLLLTDEGYEVETVNSGEEALIQVVTFKPDVVLLDLMMPGLNGIETMVELKKVLLGVQYIIITAHGDVPDAVKAINAGAYNFIKKPFDNNELIGLVKGALEVKKMYDIVANFKKILNKSQSLEMLLGENDSIKDLKKLIKRIAPTNATVLVTGESGTGKELVVQSLQELSKRKNKPFVIVNCSAISSNLFESEFFGHKKGSFTGAIKDHKGKFLEADKGTIYLDELGELPLHFQAKLLRVLENSEITPIGSSETKKVDVRVLAATNKNLANMVEAGTFREDLYFRLKTFIIEIPPLRDRVEDISLIARCFAESFNRKLSRESIQLLKKHYWKGNVRELKNEIERGSILSEDTIEPNHFSFSESVNTNQKVTISTQGLDLEKTLEKIKKEYFIKAMQITHGNKVKAAKILNISYRKFDYQWKKFQE